MQYVMLLAAFAGLTMASPAVQARDDGCLAACNAAFNACRTAPEANQSFCAATYSQCLGYSPYGTGNGTFITPTACSKTASSTSSTMSVVTSTGAKNSTTTTTVVTAFTTVCPSPTTLTFNSKTYTVTAPTTLTITNCPCTITTALPVVSTTPVKNGTAVATPTPTTSTPVIHTGAASAVKPAMALLALGAVALL